MLLTYLFDSRDKDVVFDRIGQREYYTNVPLLLQHHANGEIDWGRSCPEALDLALNILNWWIPPAIDERIPVFLKSGVASRTAWELHQDFMVEFLIRIPYEGGCLPVKRSHHWIVDKVL